MADLKRTILNFVRGVVGLNHVNARFDAVEGRLGQMMYGVAEQRRALESRLERLDEGMRRARDASPAETSQAPAPRDPTPTPMQPANMNDDTSEAFAREVIERTLHMVRQEYTVMPRFGFHQPLDYYLDTFPPVFEPPVHVAGEPLPLPPIKERMGYSADDTEYLSWGRDDKALVLAQITKHLGRDNGIAVLDFGCSSGRVLRHFLPEAKHKQWTLSGVDIQARPIQWMREHFPNEFCVYTGSTNPHLPFPDAHFDVIYGFSIFTHIKFHWDMWLLELKRVMKLGALLIQTIHTEHAWKFYYDHRDQDWVRDNHSYEVLRVAQMPYDYFYYGDISVSQVFWKREVARSYWGRYFDVLDVMPPPDRRSFQDWMVCRKPD